MRKVLIIAAMVVLVASMMATGEEPQWLDPANCDFCRPLTEPPEMLQNLHWQNFKVTNGVMTVTTFAPEWKEPYEAANAKMEAFWETFDPTKPYHMCGMCQAYMGVDWTKVTADAVDFDGGQVSLMTTTDSATLAALHSITDRTVAEYEAMLKGHMESHE